MLIQHCSEKAREAIESCVSLPPEDGYRIAKETLYENFGKPHVVAEAHIKKLLNLPSLRNGDGPSLLQFARHLKTAQRTLTGMGSSYVADLDHMHVFRELAKKLPMYIRSKWAEFAGNLFELTQRPRFAHFLDFVKARAKLVNKEFGRDLTISYSRSRPSSKDSGGSVGRTEERVQSFVVNERSGCEVCSGPHRIWNCERFKKCEYKTKRKIVLSNGLCNKCLGKGHIARTCPKIHFKCREIGCGQSHHTLLHFPKDENNSSSKQSVKITKSSQTQTGAGDQQDALVDNQSNLVATTHAGGGKICLGAIPVRVRGNKGAQEIETYALLETGSEVTLCDERLAKKLNLKGEDLRFTLTGINGSVEMESRLVDIVVKSLDGKTELELQNVKTVKEIPISSDCVPKQVDVSRWPHLLDIYIPEIENKDIMLLIGLKERPRLFLPLECKEGGESEPIAIRYSLGWTVMGPVGSERKDDAFSVNFTRVKDQSSLVIRDDNLKLTDSKEMEPANYQLYDNVEAQNQSNDVLKHQLGRLWNTDFKDLNVSNKVLPSVEDRKALRLMEESVKIIDGHFQVALPWRRDQPDIPNNKIMAERRLRSLKVRLTKDAELFTRYMEAMQNYIDKGHAQRVPEEELNKKFKVWYLPHHPVTHRLKPEKTRIVFDCAAKFNGESLNQHLLTGPDLTNSLVGVFFGFARKQSQW